MKSTVKLVVLVLLLVSWIQCIPGAATDGNAVLNNQTDYTEYLLVGPEEDWSLPGGEIFDNTLEFNEEFSAWSVQGTPFLASNGFYYYRGYSVKTKGQIDVPAYVAQTNYSNSERAIEIATIEQNFPRVLILGEPTSVYNCHSYAWYDSATSNPYWIDLVENYLDDAHTIIIPSEDIAVGDIVVYVDPNNVVQHSALITEINGDEIVCVSKWGASVLCEHSVFYVPSNYWTANRGYECYAFRVTPHENNYQSCGTMQHMASCTICSYSIQENCSFTYIYKGDSWHNAYCTKCNFGINDIFCSYAYSPNNNGTHTRTCTLSDHESVSMPCNYTYSPAGNGTHIATCTLCDYSVIRGCVLESSYVDSGSHRYTCGICGYSAVETCTAVPTYCGGDTMGDVHSPACEDCGNLMGTTTESCTFQYEYMGEVDGNNVHSYICTVCGHIKIDKTLCFYKTGNTCLQCGSLKDIHSGTIQRVNDATE